MMKKRKLLFILCIIIFNIWLLISNAFSQGVWTQMTDFGGTPRFFAVGFSIGTKGYIGTGCNGGFSTLQDFWEWDQATNVWTQKADFGGGVRSGAVGFSIGTKGYIGTGWYNGNPYTQDFWEWDQASNVWTQKTNFGGTARTEAVGFSIGTKGYIGTGRDNAGYKNDFWEYDPASNSWTKKTNFPDAIRGEATGFSIGTKGYIGMGANWDLFIDYADFWEWDQNTDTWTQKADFPTPRHSVPGFSIGVRGYCGTGHQVSGGYYNVFWEWDQGTNAWAQKANVGGTAREGAVGFSVGCKGYIGTGWDPSFKKDFWEYAPDPDPCGTLNVSVSSQNVSCNGQCTGSATGTPTGGTNPYSYAWNTLPVQTTQTATGLCAGTYSVTIMDAASDSTTAIVVVTQPTALYDSVAGTNANCNAQCNGSSLITVGGGTPGYTYNWNTTPLQTTANATGLCAGNYTVTITDANSCTATQTIAITEPAPITFSQSVSICSGTTYTLPGGTIVSTAGIYNDTLTSVNDCDSIITTTLTVNSVFTTNQSVSICFGSTYILPGGTVVITGGIYTDTLTSGNDCDSIITTNLTVYPNPTAAIFSNTTILQGQGVTLTASGSPNGGYSWSNGANSSSITVTPPTTAMYCVTITDTNNCTDTACVTVYVEPIDCPTAGEFYLPNAFSPNGDGENDKLQIYYGNIECIKTFELIIYDRWGEKVFETTNSVAEWDGSYKGKQLNTAVFVYYLEATFLSGEEISRKGNMSIFR